MLGLYQSKAHPRLLDTFQYKLLLSFGGSTILEVWVSRKSLRVGRGVNRQPIQHDFPILVNTKILLYPLPFG